MKFFIILFLLFFSFISFASVEPATSTKQTIALKRGWNLVTIAKPLENDDNNIEQFLGLHPFFLDNEHKCYVRCNNKEDVKPGMGYWIFSKTEKTIELTQDITQTKWESPKTRSGWNLIGKTEKSNWHDKASLIWKWTGISFQSITSFNTEVGKAYWIFFE